MKRLESLKAEGRIEEARQHGLLQLIKPPRDTGLHDEVACLHDNLGQEAQAIPLYLPASAQGLTGEALRGARLGLGSSYRATGVLVAFVQGLAHFSDANEFKVFRAMVCYNLMRHKEGMESLLVILAETATSPTLTPYLHAIALYAADLDRRW